MSKARLDLEKDKFDSEGRVKVSIESNNVGSFNGEVTVNNTSSEPVPVSIVNPDANIDLQVEIQPNITIDDSTPIDVNVTNSSVNTNATIQNASLDVNLTDLDVNSRLPVSVDNQPTVTIDDATPVDVNVTNTVATNATIQNTNLDVTVQNAFQYVYDMVYDGSQWRFQLSDTNGKAINLDHTYYTSSEITALGSSTDINLWLAAYNDSMLQYKYVGSYDDEFEVEVYLTHPSLGDGNKCLKLIFDYSTQNTKKVVQSVYASIVDWSFDASVTGALTITLGTVTSPDPNSAIAVGTDVCTIAVSNTGQGGITISLSGTNAGLYTLRNVTDGITGSSLAYDAAKSFVLETASDFSGSSYSHSLTITATNNLYGNTDTENVETSGTYASVISFANEKYYKASTRTGIVTPDLILSGTNKNPFADNNIMPSLDDAFSMSFWLQVPSAASNFDPVIAFAGSDTRAHFKVYHLNGKFTASLTSNSNAADYSFSHTTYNTWQHVVITKKAVIPRSPNYDNTDYFLQIYIDGVAKNPSVSYFDNNPGFASTSWGNLTVSEVIISGPARSYTTNNAYASNKSGRQWKVDELAFYNKELSQSEVTTIYNSGTTKDLMDLASSFNLSKYFRFGDHTSDVDTTGSIQCYDEVLDTVYFEDNDGTIENHAASDAPYVPASGSWANDYYALGTTDANCRIKLYADFDLSASWTISFWVYADAYSGLTYLNSFFPITTLKTSSYTDETFATYYPAGLYGSFRNNTNAGNPDYFGFTNDNNSNSGLVGYISNYSSSNYLGGAWNNVIITWDSTYYNSSSISQSSIKSGLNWYVNNVAIAKSSDYAPTATINPADYIFTGISFGAHSASRTSNKYYGGRLDGVAIWTNHLVSTTERGYIYNSGTPQDLMNTSGLTSPSRFWIMEDNTDLTYDVKNSASNQGSNTNFVRTAH